MNDLDLVVHNENRVSIRDLEKDIDINDAKWNFIFHTILEKTQEIYFKGSRLNFIDDEFENTIRYLSDESFINESTSKHSSLLIRLKPFDFKYNRRLLAKVWGYYDNPSLFFLASLENQHGLVRMLKGTFFYDELINSIDKLFIIYLSSQPDVLWFEGNVDFQF